MTALGLQHLNMPNLRGRSIGEMKSGDPNWIKSSIWGWLKNLRTDGGESTKGKSGSRSQPNKGETKPKKARQAAESRRAESRRLGRGQTWLRALKKTN